MGSLDSGHEEYTHACFLPKQGREGDWNSMGSWPVAHDCSSMHLSLSRVPAVVSLASQCSYTLEQRLPRLRAAVIGKGGSRPRRHLGRAGAAIANTYWGSTSEVAQASDYDSGCHTHTQTQAEPLLQPLLLLLQHHSSPGQGSQG